MTERKSGNWIKGFQFYTSESESPDSYLTWVALSTIAGATQRQVKVKWLYYDYYPNLYTILVGPPGVTHKSSAMKFGRNMLEAIQIPISSEAITKEALIDQIIGKNKDKRPMRSAITIHSSDFMTFVQASGPSMIEFLTDVYDSQDKWEYTTRKHGSQLLKNVFINLLAGTTPSWISETFSIAFVEQGFASRTLFVHADQPRFRKAFSLITPKMEEMFINLLEDLVAISKVTGDFRWTDDGIKWFKKWYEEELPDEDIDYRLRGYLFRKPTHVIKIGMLLALSDGAEGKDLILDERYLSTAKKLLDNIEPEMSKTFHSVGKNPYANDLMRIYHDIKNAKGLSEQKIRRMNLGAMEKAKIEEQLENLKAMGLIKIGAKAGKIWWFPSNEEENENV